MCSKIRFRVSENVQIHAVLTRQVQSGGAFQEMSSSHVDVESLEPRGKAALYATHRQFSVRCKWPAGTGIQVFCVHILAKHNSDDDEGFMTIAQYFVQSRIVRNL